MKADFSRVTFDAAKHYSAVYPLQGRVITDADLVEEHDIQEYRVETEAVDVVGPSGTQKGNNGFQLSIDANKRLTIGKGRFYCDGILCENEGLTRYDSQPFLPEPDPIERVLSGSANPPTPVVKLGLVYLDAFRRLRTVLDDPQIQETALGGTDTSVRAQTVWQVKVLPLTKALGTESLAAIRAFFEIPLASQDRKVLEKELVKAGVICTADFSEWNSLVARRTGTLTVDTPKTDGSTDPCDVPPGAGYLNGENQLYRVEVHAADPAGRAGSTFKWSRENGSVVALIERAGTQQSGDVSTQEVIVNSLGKDGGLGFHANDWVEYIDDYLELTGRPGPLVQIAQTDPGSNKITLKSTIQVNFGSSPKPSHPKLRRWEGVASRTAIPMNTTDSAWVSLEGNIKVRFSNGSYRTGDYWVIPARATTGQVEYPLGVPLSPAGVRHCYARLGFVLLDGTNLQLLSDCRETFPSLTDIAATDVSYDNTHCPDLKEAANVQEALDELCRQKAGHCTFTAVPGKLGWESVFDKIKAGEDAEICFPVGEYPLQKTVEIRGKGHLTLSGCGAGTRILAPQIEAALRFVGCRRVVVRDLSAETGGVGTGEGLNGTLSFADCEDVLIDHVFLKCGADGRRGASCITVINQQNDPKAVRIIRCDLKVGFLQEGILLVNVSRAHIEDNLVAGGSGRTIPFDRLVQNPEVLESIRKLVIGNPKVEAVPAEIPGDADHVFLKFGTKGISLKTEPDLKAMWNGFFRNEENLRDVFVGEESIADLDGGKLIDPVTKWVGRLLTDEAYKSKVVERFPSFGKFLDRLKPLLEPLASRGITVGGQVSREVRILNNSLSGVLAGISVGLSDQSPTALSSESVSISGNLISVTVSFYAGQFNKHGIMVGNCKSLFLGNNDLRLSRVGVGTRFLTDGIQVAGMFGPRMVVAENTVSAFDFGIHISSKNTPFPAPKLWLISDNYAPNRTGGSIKQEPEGAFVSRNNVP